MEALKIHINSVVSIHEEELTEIAKAFLYKKVNRDAYLLKPGQYCDSYYFLKQGSLRIFTNVAEKEISSWFAFEGYFFTELESYANQSRTRFSIQAIEDSAVYYIQRKKMDDFLNKSFGWNEFIRKTWEQSFIKLQDVVLSFQAQPAGKRYENLLDYPYYIQKIRQQDLASMLGITKYSLSRLRGKK